VIWQLTQGQVSFYALVAGACCLLTSSAKRKLSSSAPAPPAGAGGEGGWMLPLNVATWGAAMLASAAGLLSGLPAKGGGRALGPAMAEGEGEVVSESAAAAGIKQE